MSRAQVINLSYSKETGFQNSTMLPRTDEKIERLLIHPPFHVAIAGPFLRRKVEKLPIIDSFEHLSLGQRIRAFQILGFVAHAYIWGNEKTKEMNELPPQLARPLEKLGQEIGIAPLATYATTVLWNCSLKDTSKPWVPENVIVDTTFTNTDAEKKFYAIRYGLNRVVAKVMD
ncbi:hypothetical protein M433DRAFT_8428 [Acidomyces richmondensis BFW]|nr:hypothetical protein M433DRAFT_8428 [Acidomyces richmondensis BFW]